jgi:hypothetical protein
VKSVATIHRPTTTEPTGSPPEDQIARTVRKEVSGLQERGEIFKRAGDLASKEDFFDEIAREIPGGNAATGESWAMGERRARFLESRLDFFIKFRIILRG